MTNEEIERIAHLMNARIVGELPDVVHGATGAAHLARFYQSRMEALHFQEAHQHSGHIPAQVLEIPLDPPLKEGLESLVDWLSPPDKKVSLEVLAAVLLSQSTVQMLEQAAQEHNQAPNERILVALRKMVSRAAFGKDIQATR